MDSFFPHGFWAGVAIIGMVIFLLFGVDMVLFRARIVTGLSGKLNKSFHVDEMIIRMLESLKKKSDHEFDIEHSILGGWGRFVAGGVLISAAFLLFNLLPALK